MENDIIGGNMSLKSVFGLEGKNVVITGASSGMGKAATELLLEVGANVYAVGGTRHTVDLPVAQAYKADFSTKEGIDALIAQLPQDIEALFLCHAIAHRPGKNEVLTQKVNFLSIKILIEALVDRIADNGSITIISSNGGYGWEKPQVFELSKEVIDLPTYEATLAWYESHPDQIASAYVFAKHCINAYVQYKVFEPKIIDRKIRINTICPGNTLTGLTDEFNIFSSATGDPEEGRRNTELLFQDRWNGRWATADEMGYPLVAIGSKLFSYMSGQVIYIDYGITSAWTIDRLLHRESEFFHL
jgi:NAD(P)-dependent dehydrogenase (short-subunit alcohol dehydrogenase family)